MEIARERGEASSFVLFEAGPRLGGVISTVRRDGFVVEEGPDSFVTDKPWARDQIGRLGLGDRLIGTRPEYRRSFIVRRGRLVPTPEGFYLLAPGRLAPFWRSPLFSLAGKLRASAELLVPRGAPDGDESLGRFVRRRFGREVLERAAQPMVAGIYGADPEELSLAATFPRFLELERKHGSVIRGLRASARNSAAHVEASGPRYGVFATLDDGLGTWIDALAHALPPESVRLGAPVESLRPGWIVKTSAGEERFDAVILAVPAYQAARLVRSWDEPLARDLDSISYGSSVTVSMAYEEGAIHHPMNGSGFVVPATETLSILGCTFAHRKFGRRAPAGFALLRAFLGGSALDWSDQRVSDVAHRELSTLLGISSPPIWSHATRHVRAIPRYRVGHAELVRRIQNSVETRAGLVLAGATLAGIGLPDCVRSGNEAAGSCFVNTPRGQ